MYASNVLAVSGAFIAAVAAVPMAGERHHMHHARELVWETVTDEVVVTVPLTKTIWIEPGETPPSEHQPHGYGAPSSTTPAAEPAAYTPSSSAAPAPAYTPETSSSSSVYVAPPAYTPESSSSVYVAPPAYTPPAYTPEPSTSVYVAPTPESTYVAPAPTSYAAPAASSSAPSYSGGSGSGSSTGALSYGMAASGTSHTGDLTYYEPGLGACGFTNTTSEPIVAISEAIFDSYSTGNPNTNPLCQKWITIHAQDGSKQKAQIVDRCPGCDTYDLDLTQSLFDTCTVKGDGRVHGITWTMD